MMLVRVGALLLLASVHSASTGWFGPREFKKSGYAKLQLPFKQPEEHPASRRKQQGGSSGVLTKSTVLRMPVPVFKYFLGIGNSLSRYWYYRAIARCGQLSVHIDPTTFDRKSKRWFAGSFLRHMHMDVAAVTVREGTSTNEGCAWSPLAGDFAKFPHEDARFAVMLGSREQHAPMVRETAAALRAELLPSGSWPPKATGADVVVHLRCGDVVEGHIKGAEYGVPTFGFIAEHLPPGTKSVSVIGNVKLDTSAARNAQDGDAKARRAHVDGPRRCAAILEALLTFLRARGLTADFASERHSSVSEDFALAAQAKFFIGSPSTFSLMAALSNSNPCVLPATPLFFGCRRCAECAPELAAANTRVVAANYLSAGEITEGQLSTEQVVDALKFGGLSGRRCAQAVSTRVRERSDRATPPGARAATAAHKPVPIAELRRYARSQLVALTELPAGRVAMEAHCKDLYGMSVCSPALAKVLQYLQLEAPCNQQHQMIVNKRKLWNNGIGADLINRQADVRLNALQHNKGVVFAVPGVPWIYDRECAERWWECLFRPSSVCKSTDGRTLVEREHATHGAKAAVAAPTPAEFSAAVEAAGDGALFRAHTIALTLSPLPDLQRRMRALKKDIGWEAPMIGVHMRHGDIWKEHTVLSARAYADIVVQTYVASKVPRVFLATDAKEVTPASFLALVRGSAEARGVTLPASFSVHQQRVRDTGDEKKRSTQSTAQGLGAMADLMLLAQSEVLVAMYGSGFGKVATLLGVARYGLRKFAFVDCDTWGRNKVQPPTFSWLTNHTIIIPWHGAHCTHKWAVRPPAKSRWSPDNVFATDEWNDKCARNADACVVD